MKAMTCAAFAPIEALSYGDFPAPEAGPGEVVIDVVAAGVNYPDVLIVQGKYQTKPPLPFVPGSEASGRIAAIGEGVEGFAVGDRVIAFTGSGSFAAQVKVPATQVWPVPDGVDLSVAAGIAITYGTSYHGLKDRAALKPGETLLVLGAGGGVGLTAVELGKQMGARVIAAASSPEKLALAKQQGADELINYSDEDLRERIKALTDGKGVDVVYDPVGGAMTLTAVKSLAWGGRLLVIGFAGGEISTIPANLLLLKSASAVGVLWGNSVRADPVPHGANMRQLLDWLAAGTLNPVIDRRFALRDAVAALAHLEGRQVKGKVLLTMEDLMNMKENTAMSETVAYRVEGDIAEAVIDNPPVNATSGSVRQGLEAAIKAMESDDAVAALIIRCEGKTFIAGADIKEFGKPMADPGLPEVMAMMDRASKPIIAAVHGTVLGGGFEVALACHYRVADPKTSFGFPEVKLGVMPGGGGTQRTPRLAGLKAAIPLVTQGKPISAKKALDANLIDAIAEEGDLRTAAFDFTRALIAQGKGPRNAGALPMPADDPALFEEAKATLAKAMKGQTAPLRALEAIRLGYSLPFKEAVVQELAIFRECMASPQSRALRSLFAAEREVARIPGLAADTPTRPVGSIGVIGLGVMGRGIVMTIAAAGIPVVAVGRDQAHVDAAMKAIDKMWSSSVAKGRMSEATMEAQRARITTSTNVADLGAVDLIIEAVTENIDIKKEVFAQLGQVAKSGAILASNTSFLNIDTLAQASGRPNDVCGMHFFNPANVMRLLENVRAGQTDTDVVATIMAVGKRIGKLAILSGVCDGFIVNRMLSKRSREAFFLVEEGASPAAIDKVLLSYGFPMGPFALGDLAGLDVQAAARKSRAASMTERELRADFPEQLVAAGRLGQKTGSGWYIYDENRKASPDPRTDEMIAAHAERHGLALREISEDEIRERLLYAMVNEGAKILDEGIAARPHEIDVAMVNGLGWPSYQGGPMRWADEIGLDKVLATIEKFRAEQGDAYWTPSSLLVAHAKAGRGFYA